MAEITETVVDIEAFGYKQELKRTLSLFDLLVYGLIFIVPVAPFAVFGIVFNASKGMVPLIYVVGLVAMIFTALSYRAMSRAFPIAGSVYTYASRSIGPEAGFLAGWAILLDYLLIPTLTYVACAIALSAVIPGVPKAVWIVLLLGFSTVINYLGIEATAKLNVVMLILQLVILAVLMGVAVVALKHGVSGAHLSFKPFYNPQLLSPSLIFGALALAMLSFLGFDAISTLSEEAKGGPNVVGLATVLSLCIAAVLFVVQTYMMSLFVLGRTSFPQGDATTQAMYNISQTIGGHWLEVMVAVLGVLFSGIAGALSAQAATARLIFSMARDGKGRLSQYLAYVNPVRKVPERAVFLVAIVTLVLGIVMVDQLELLTSMVNFGALIGFMLVHLSVMAYFLWRRKSRDWYRHLILPAIGFLIIAYVFFNLNRNAMIIGCAWLAVGVANLLWLRFRGRPVALPVAP
jgi:amino acid transporter